MANQEILTDDYVAGLLARDAKQSSIKYSAVGLEAFTSSSKPPANKPKPNTRFLRNIIKDTDNHNAALLAKEAGEARARLESLATKDHREAKASRVGGGDIRRRQLGDIAAILGGGPSKRRKTNELKKPERDARRRNASSDEDEPRRRSEKEERPRRKDEDEDVNAERSRSHKSQRRRRRSVSEDRYTDDRKRRHRSRSRSPREHRESRHRHRSPKRERSLSRDDTDTGRERSHRSHHSSSKRKRSISREDSGLRKDKSRHSRRRSVSIERYVPKKRIENSMKNKEPKPQPERKPDYDSDPLDDIIGPRPPPVQQVRTRGRGTISQASGIDSRFASNYDPTLDVQLNPDEENDWDQALEALKDRQKWKQQGADRLRAAGFTEDEIVKWEKGGEKREEDVKWSKKGEGREWDKGKVLDDDGIVSLKPEWGRLKGT